MEFMEGLEKSEPNPNFWEVLTFVSIILVASGKFFLAGLKPASGVLIIPGDQSKNGNSGSTRMGVDVLNRALETHP